MYFPNTLCAVSHVYSFFELLRKQAAASNKKGVVGKTGIKIPTTPVPRVKNPAVKYKYFFMVPLHPAHTYVWTLSFRYRSCFYFEILYQEIPMSQIYSLINSTNVRSINCISSLLPLLFAFRILLYAP